jgi:hypothetical protein
MISNRGVRVFLFTISCGRRTAPLSQDELQRLYEASGLSKVTVRMVTHLPIHAGARSTPHTLLRNVWQAKAIKLQYMQRLGLTINRIAPPLLATHLSAGVARCAASNNCFVLRDGK